MSDCGGCNVCRVLESRLQSAGGPWGRSEGTGPRSIVLLSGKSSRRQVFARGRDRDRTW